MKITVVVPARYASMRFPGKMLADLGGKPLVQHTYEQAVKADVGKVIIATDDDRIAKVAEGFNAKVVMTKPEHRSGTERIAECAKLLKLKNEDVIVNLQGDEPFLPPELIRQVSHNLINHEAAQMATLCEPLDELRDLFNANVVKVVFDHKGYAIYFSRAVIPWHRNGFGNNSHVMPVNHVYYRHIGIYAYTVGFLKEYMSWEEASLEQVEALEQLRAIWHGAKIHVGIATKTPGIGVDTPEDLKKAQRGFTQRPSA